MAIRPRFRMEGTWLRSRLARRIFLMFCAVALLPAALVFWLTWRQADRAVDASEQRSLHDETRFVAFTLLGRLQSADEVLARIADRAGPPGGGGTRMFDAIVRQRVDAAIDPDALPRLRVVPARPDARVVLLAPRREAGALVLYAGVVAPGHLWRKDEDVVDGTRVCVRAGAHGLGCAGAVDRAARLRREAWELDLAGEFGAPPWRFEAERESAASLAPQLGWFAALAGGALLLAVLMSLVQIRRTLVPLETLMGRIRLFSGLRAPTGTDRGRDELAALSATFDAMQQRIGGQLARLRGLAEVDAGILARAPLAGVLAQVAHQLHALAGVGDAAIAVDAADGTMDITCAGPGTLLDAQAVRHLVARQAPDPAQGWRAVDIDGDRPAPSPVRAWCLRISQAVGRRAWVVLAPAASASLDEDTLEAARQLGDRIAIALALEAHEGHLLHQARHDTLTGLPNRLAALEALDAAVARGHAFAVAFLDLDRFKSVNDGLGHALGDGLLAAVAARLRDAVPPGDLVTRFGGDEFVLLLHGVSHPVDLDTIRARLDDALAAPVRLGDHALAVRYSAGVAFHPADAASAGDLVRMADMAMYRAKQEGGGRFAVYSPGMDEAAREEVELVAALRAALEAGELDVHFQPRIEARTGRWAGMEALVRWHRGAGGWIPPARFVPLAETHGLIGALGRFVLHATCRHVAAWRALGLEPGRVAVNVSGEQLRAGTLVGEFERVVHDTGVRWSDLEVEITESVLIADADASGRQLQALRERGVHVAIDDFGTGYSSLAYLARLPLDTIKIDRAFVVALEQPGTASVVKAMLALAAALGKRVITEGVETEAQLRTLQAWGCELFQGYLFHRPMPAADVQCLLEARAAGGTRDPQSREDLRA